MVQYKRKPVVYIQEQPPHHPRKTEVWPIWETKEIFTDYDSYLHRLDFYRQRKFTCEITGHTGLTFFEALDSEREEAKDLDTSFPEKLREPVLRKSQFSTISRINELVNYVHSELEADFFPGEWVVYTGREGTKWEGMIREKIHHNARRNSDGSIRAPFARYTVESVDGGPDHHAEPLQLSRDRKIFNKQLLRSFLKGSIRRESWLGAPWTVKQSLAKIYRISTDIPPELQYEAKMAERRSAASAKGESISGLTNSGINSSRSNISNSKPMPYILGLSFHNQGKPYPSPSPDGQFGSFPSVESNGVNYKGSKARFLQYSPGRPPVTKEAPPMPPPPPPPPIKYPIEDLEIKPKPNILQRPPLQFMVDDPPLQKPRRAKDRTGLKMRSVGPLLEIWNTLNVHCEVFILDSFTFDDLVDAMLFSSDDMSCELFVEVHCAVLKQLVNEKGDLQVTLPEFPDDEEDEEEDEDEEESVQEEKTPTPQPEIPPRRTTRSSLAKEELLRKERSPTAESEGPANLAAEMQEERDWIERLQARDFRDGGWEVVMVGLLHQVALNPREQEICEEILAHLAPVDMEPTQETAEAQYVTLDVNLRVAALEIACMLAVRTKALRSFMEQCSEAMTDLRKEKIEMQRKRKLLVVDLRELDEQRKILLPENMPGTPPPELNGDATGKTNGITNGNVNGIVDSKASSSPDVEPSAAEAEDPDAMDTEEEDDSAPRRGLRRASERMNVRKRKREDDLARKEKAKKEKLEASKAGKQSAEFKKLLRDIDKKKDAIKKCEDAIAEFDSDLREANCQRTKVLGRDRYCYRYYWYERNGMPFGGLPNSSTADYGYANGRIWIQGPDDMEREGYIDLPDDEMREYVEKIGMTVEDRRKRDEGDTRLHDAHQWGYIDDPDAIDRLIAWLDDRGRREKQLRKELIAWRDPIVDCMQKMRKHLDEVTERKASATADDQPARVSTRNKTYVDVDAAIAHPCLLWENKYAKYELKHLHSEPPKPKPKKEKAKKGLAAVEKAAVREKSGRTTKQATRTRTR